MLTEALERRPDERPWIVFTAGAMGVGKSYAMLSLHSEGLFPLDAFQAVAKAFEEVTAPAPQAAAYSHGLAVALQEVETLGRDLHYGYCGFSSLLGLGVGFGGVRSGARFNGRYRAPNPL